MKPSCLLTLITLVSAVSMPASANEPSHSEHLKALEWMIGSWVWKWDTNQAVPGIAQSGEQLSGEMLCKWDLDKSAIDMHLRLTKTKKTVWAVHTLVGWDHVTKELISRSFDSAGGHGEGTFAPQGNNWLLKTSGVNAQGNNLVNALLFSDIGPDGFSLQGTNRKEDSDEVAFGPRTKFRRKSPRETRAKTETP